MEGGASHAILPPPKSATEIISEVASVEVCSLSAISKRKWVAHWQSDSSVTKHTTTTTTSHLHTRSVRYTFDRREHSIGHFQKQNSSISTRSKKYNIDWVKPGNPFQSKYTVYGCSTLLFCRYWLACTEKSMPSAVVYFEWSPPRVRQSSWKPMRAHHLERRLLISSSGSWKAS